MAYALGAVIAFLISLTGVGAGTVTVPALVLLLGAPAQVAVALGLTFSAAIKLVLVPVQVARKNVAWPTLRSMLMGGVPGVLIGSLLLKKLVSLGSQSLVNLLLGLILVTIAILQIFLMLYWRRDHTQIRDRSAWMKWLMLPVGAEVGFSSAGAGALGNAALLSLTPLSPSVAVGTDITFGFVLSLIGAGAHIFSLHGQGALLAQLVTGGVFGGVCGILAGQSIPRRPLRYLLWSWIIFIGGNMVVHNAHSVRMLF